MNKSNLYDAWQRLDDDYLATRDVAFGNLRSAVGLPGPAVDLAEIPALQDKLDDWASLVRTGTDRMLPKFLKAPDQYEGTLGRFQMLVLVTVLQRNLGVTYNRVFSEGEYDASDPRNLFLHGVLNGFGGTCVTMPLLYVAIGRRLGYPLFLVEAKQHFFVRWEGRGERFNIEATSPGFNPRDSDEYYLEWPEKITADEVEKGYYLRNLTPREELGCSWHSRGSCFFEHLMLDHTIKAFENARTMAPQSPNVRGSLLVALAARTILQNIASLPAELPLSERLHKATPPASQPWQAWAIGRATDDLLRIDRNRRMTAGETTSSVATYVVNRIGTNQSEAP